MTDQSVSEEAFEDGFDPQIAGAELTDEPRSQWRDRGNSDADKEQNRQRDLGRSDSLPHPGGKPVGAKLLLDPRCTVRAIRSGSITALKGFSLR